jgi:hypothetical protein
LVWSEVGGAGLKATEIAGGVELLELPQPVKKAKARKIIARMLA